MEAGRNGTDTLCVCHSIMIDTRLHSNFNLSPGTLPFPCISEN